MAVSAAGLGVAHWLATLLLSHRCDVRLRDVCCSLASLAFDGDSLHVLYYSHDSPSVVR